MTIPRIIHKSWTFPATLRKKMSRMLNNSPLKRNWLKSPSATKTGHWQILIQMKSLWSRSYKNSRSLGTSTLSNMIARPQARPLSQSSMSLSTLPKINKRLTNAASYRARVSDSKSTPCGHIRRVKSDPRSKCTRKKEQFCNLHAAALAFANRVQQRLRNQSYATKTIRLALRAPSFDEPFSLSMNY